MKFPIAPIACLFAVVLGSTAQAEIYESKDAQGNPVFTDTPTAGAEAVDLPKTNVVDAAQEAPHATPTSNATPATNKQSGHSNVTVIKNSHNEQLTRELAADKPHEVLEAEKRYEVGDQPTAEEMKRREEARKGELVDEEGNTVRYIHRGKAH